MAIASILFRTAFHTGRFHRKFPHEVYSDPQVTELEYQPGTVSHLNNATYYSCCKIK